MITTIDGKELKRGDRAWIIGKEIGTWLYKPGIHRIHIDQTVSDIYSTYESAKLECYNLNISRLKQLQSELDECNESCDIITQTYFGKEEPVKAKESYAKYSLRSIEIQKEMKLIIEGL